MDFFQSFIYILLITLLPLIFFKLVSKDITINKNLGITIVIINIILTLSLCYYFQVNIYLAVIESLLLNILNYHNIIDNNFTIKKFIPTIKLLLVLFLFFIIPNITYIFINEVPNERLDTLLNLIGNLILIIILILIYFHDLIKYIKAFKQNFKEDMQIGLKAWYIGLTIMALSNIVISVIFKNTSANNEKLVQEMINNAPLLTLIATAIQAPIIEEITFRKTLKDIFTNPFLFIFFSGLAFGAFHIIFTMTSYIDLLFILPYGALGASFAYMYNKTNNLCVPIIFHFIHNFLLTMFSIIL